MWFSAHPRWKNKPSHVDLLLLAGSMELHNYVNIKDYKRMEVNNIQNKRRNLNKILRVKNVL